MGGDGRIQCEYHGMQLCASTSPRLRDAARLTTPVPDYDIVEYEITMSFGDPDRIDKCLVDADFIKKFIDKMPGAKVRPLDRDIKNKRLNDRLLIMRIGKELEPVCPLCLEFVTGRPTPAPGWMKVLAVG